MQEALVDGRWAPRQAKSPETPGPATRPGLHSIGVMERCVQKLPSVHFKHCASPPLGWYSPARQPPQTLLPAAAALPGSHSAGSDVPLPQACPCASEAQL